MKNLKRIIACTLVVLMVCTCVTPNVNTQTVTAGETELLHHSLTAGKTETVYVVLDSNGNVEKTIVSNTLKNPEGDTSLEDYSELRDIEVVKGHTKCVKNEAGNIEWKTDGGDIYYQGTTDKELPITVHIAYELDGKKVSAEELAGATGHLKITFSYDNNVKKEMVIDGEKCTIYQPFSLVSGIILDNEKAKNVTVTNGDVADSGDKTTVFGIAMPGLKESLGFDDVTDLEIPEEVVIEADVKDFSLMTTITVASNNALEKLGLDDIDSIDDLKADIDKLKDGMGEITDGATELSDGVVKLSDGTDTLSNGVNDLSNGAAELKEGAYKLADGASELNDGANRLKDGLKSLSDSAPALVEGVGQLTSGADQLASGIAEITANNDALNQGAATLSDGLMQLNLALTDENTVNQIVLLTQGSDTFSAGLGNASAGLEQIVAGYNYSEGDLAVVIGGLSAYAETLAANPDTAEVGGYINALIGAYQGLYDNTSAVAGGVSALNGSYGQINGGINSLAGNLTNVSQAVGQLSAGSTQLKSGISVYTDGVNRVAQGIGSVDAGLNSLNGMVPSLVGGIDQLSAGANTLADGTLELKNGSNSLAGGTDKLANGTTDLKNGVGDLVSGVSALLDGSVELKDGVVKYNDEGISKLYDTVNDSLVVYYDRLKAVSDYAKEYKTFAGCRDDIESSVRFIYKSGEIKK
ncbi:MAG: hypothetical protein ACI4AQ_07395 [Lachnospiraceae bacterium]